jgi:hypothetical protein
MTEVELDGERDEDEVLEAEGDDREAEGADTFIPGDCLPVAKGKVKETE